MRIAVRGGHNWKVIGARGIVDEVAEDRKIYPYIISNLIREGHDVLDVTPNTTNTQGEDLKYGVSRANNFKADIGLSVHLNSAPDASGTEVIYYPGSLNGKAIAERIADRLSKLGFKNRGAKASKELYELNNSHMPWNIVECFFCTSAIDVEIYRKLGPEVIGKAIVEGILGVDMLIQQISKPKEESKVKNLVVYGNDKDRRAAEYLADYLGCATLDGSIPYDYSQVENVYGVGGAPTTHGNTGWTGYVKKVIAGSDRYDTCQKVLDIIKGREKL